MNEFLSKDGIESWPGEEPELKQPFSIRVEVNGKPLKTLLEYEGKARIKYNRLVFDITFTAEGVEIDLRGAPLGRESLELLLRSLQSFSIGLPGTSKDNYNVTVRVLGVRLSLKRRR